MHIKRNSLAKNKLAEQITEPVVPEKKTKHNRKINLVLLLIILPLAAYFWFGLSHLSQFETADEHLWISNLYTGRIQNYWNAAADKDWAHTHINDKPGISLAYISGIGSWFEGNVGNKIIAKQNLWTKYDPQTQERTYCVYRLPIVIFNGLMSLFFFLAFWRLTKEHWLALVAASFILLSPVLIGISQIINPDALLWVFSFASLLSFLLFLKGTRFIDGFLAALFLGFALLSKYVAILLIPFFLAVLLAYMLFDCQDPAAQGTFRKKIIFITLGYLLIIAGGIGVFALLMPAALVNLKLLYDSVIDFKGQKMVLYASAGIDGFILLDVIILKSFLAKFFTKHLQILKIILPKILYAALILLAGSVLATWSLGHNFLNIPDIIKSKNLHSLISFKHLIMQAQALIYSLTPITLLLMIFLWIKSIFRKSKFDYLVFIFSAFIAVYLVAITKMDVLTTTRYSIMLYPTALALAGIGFYEIVSRMKNYYAAILFLLVLAFSGINVWLAKPFYFNYENNFLPKKLAIETSWGYGGYEAVDYINSMGNAKNMKIWTNYYGVCPFFAGKCVMEGQVKWMKDTDVANIDYVVLSAPGMDKNSSGLQSINQIFPTDKPVWELDIDGRPENFIKVYKNPLKK